MAPKTLKWIKKQKTKRLAKNFGVWAAGIVTVWLAMCGVHRLICDKSRRCGKLLSKFQELSGTNCPHHQLKTRLSQARDKLTDTMTKTGFEARCQKRVPKCCKYMSSQVRQVREICSACATVQSNLKNSRQWQYVSLMQKASLPGTTLSGFAATKKPSRVFLSLLSCAFPMIEVWAGFGSCTTPVCAFSASTWRAIALRLRVFLALDLIAAQCSLIRW